MKTKDKKNEIKEQVREDVTMLQEEIKKLKMQLGGHKTTNNLLRKELQKMKAYAKEADELNEQKANRILELIANQENTIKELEDATNKIKGLEYLCEVNKNKYEKAQQKFTEVDKEWTVLKANVEWYNSLPWYRRIFKKI